MNHKANMNWVDLNNLQMFSLISENQTNGQQGVTSNIPLGEPKTIFQKGCAQFGSSVMYAETHIYDTSSL